MSTTLIQLQTHANFVNYQQQLQWATVWDATAVQFVLNACQDILLTVQIRTDVQNAAVTVCTVKTQLPTVHNVP